MQAQSNQRDIFAIYQWRSLQLPYSFATICFETFSKIIFIKFSIFFDNSSFRSRRANNLITKLL